MMIYIVCIILAVWTIVRELIYAAERRDLINRITAKDVSEYRILSDPAPDRPKAKSRHRQNKEKWRSLTDE